MYNIFNLPTEIIEKIFNHLDTKSKINVYSCHEFRDFFAMRHLRTLVLSRSRYAAASMLSHDLIIDNGQYIRELDLSGVQDLTVDVLKQHIGQWTQLTALDITFTQIYLSDMVDIGLPRNLRKLGINYFKFSNVKPDIWEKCQYMFRKSYIEKIHFVIFQFLNPNDPLVFLNTVPRTKDLKITVVSLLELGENTPVYYVRCFINNFIHFEKLNYEFRDCRLTSIYGRGLATIDYRRVEYIMIIHSDGSPGFNCTVILVSPIFTNVITEKSINEHVIVSSYPNLNNIGINDVTGNSFFKCWNKATTFFNNQFFEDVLAELSELFPCFICLHNDSKTKLVDTDTEWYCIDCCEGFETQLDSVPKKLTLMKCITDGVTECDMAISLLPDNMASLKYLTFLTITNIRVQNDFFHVLFTQCCELVTLDIYQVRPYHLPECYIWLHSLADSIHIARSLKNFRLTVDNLEYGVLFRALPLCVTLENVYIREVDRKIYMDDVINVGQIKELIANCENLYSLFLSGILFNVRLLAVSRYLREFAEKLNKNHLRIDVHESRYLYNPFSDVFHPIYPPFRLVQKDHD